MAHYNPKIEAIHWNHDIELEDVFAINTGVVPVGDSVQFGIRDINGMVVELVDGCYIIGPVGSRQVMSAEKFEAQYMIALVPDQG